MRQKRSFLNPMELVTALTLICLIISIASKAEAKNKTKRVVYIDCTKPSIQQFDFDEPLMVIVPKPIKMKSQADIDRQADIDFEDIKNRGGQ